MRKLGRVLGATTLIGLLSMTIGAGCDITKDGGECSRLREFSCDCFPSCQEGDIDVTASQDDARCKARLKQQFEFWKKGCFGRCELGGPDCVFGWGSCAAGYYRQIGLSAEATCTAAGTGGTGAGGAADAS